MGTRALDYADITFDQALVLDDPEYHDGTDYTLVPGHSFCWITVGSYVVKIKRSTTGEGVGVEIYRADDEESSAGLERIVLESRRKCEFCGGHGNRYELFDGEYHECNSCTNGMREHGGKNYPDE
jgi:hypothetical protein